MTQKKDDIKVKIVIAKEFQFNIKTDILYIIECSVKAILLNYEPQSKQD